MSPEANAGRGIRRLYWGPGPAPPGWVRLAGPGGAAPDLTCDIVTDGLPLPSADLECIVCQLEPQHLPSHDLVVAFREFERVLEPGGVLRLGFVDLDKAIEAYRQGRADHFWCVEWMSLSGNFVSQILEGGTIRTPLTREFAREILLAAGFAGVRAADFGRTSSAWPEVASFDRRAAESSFVEAIKGPPAVRPSAPGPADQVHLSWKEDPATTFTVVWRTPSGEGGNFLEHRLAGSEAWTRVDAAARPSPGGGILHEATVSGLSPESEYEYRTSGDRGASPSLSGPFRTRTAPPPGPADFTFAFICDMGLAGRKDGNATGSRRVLEEILADRPLFVLGGGDYAYSDRDGRFGTVGEAIDAWFQEAEPLIARVPFLAQYGNHEVFLRERYRDWAPRFAHPELSGGRSYSIAVGDVHFAGVFLAGTPQVDTLDWLDRDLEGARARGARWLVVWQHEPVFAHGRSHPADPRVREALAPIFERHRVDLHLSGHDQSYERTHPLRIGRDCFSWTSLSVEAYGRGSGVIYAKVSPGGKMSDRGNDFSRFRVPKQLWMAVRDDLAHHYALVTILGKGELVFQAFRVPGDGRPKEVLDSFRVVDTFATGPLRIPTTRLPDA